MARRFVKSLGKHVTFPDNWTPDQISKWESDQGEDDGIDALDALGSGWKSGWRDAKRSGADYIDLLGLEERADEIRSGLDEDAAGEGFAPEGFVEKMLSAVGSAPGAVVGMLPAIGVGAGVTAATANPLLGAAAGFGLHGAVRGGEGDFNADAVKEGLIGAGEGLAFGGLGKVAGGLVKPMARRAVQGAGGVGIGAGGNVARAVAHGEDVDSGELMTQAAMMGLLGAAFPGKPTTEALTKGVEKQITAKRAIKEFTEDAGIAGTKPPAFPFNLDLLSPKLRTWAIEQYQAGNIKHPERMSWDKMRKVALDSKRPDLARELVLNKGELAGQELLTMAEFRGAADEAATLNAKMAQARSSGDLGLAKQLQQEYDDMAQDVMALAALDQGFGTEVARALSARNALRHELPLSEQALLYMQKKKKLDTDSFNKIMGAATDDEIRAITKTAWNPTLGDKAYEMWMMSMLSNPITWGPTGVNTISNLAKDTLLKYPVKAVQAVVEPIRAKRAGREAQYDFKTLADDFAVDLAESGPSIRQWARDVLTDKTMESGKIELSRGVAIGGQQGASAAEKALGYVTRVPGRFLEATDQFFRGKAEQAEALRMATEKIGRGPGWDERRKLAKTIITDVDSFKGDDKEWARMALKRIKNAGDEAVFTRSLREQSDHNAIAKLANVAQNLKQNNNPYVSVPAKMIVPFTRTPANIAIDALNHSPFGVREVGRLKNLIKSQEAATKAGPQAQVLQRDISEQISKTVVGSTMMSYALYEAMNGNVTGGGPTDYNDYQKWLEAGNQPYSFKLGDKWISYQRIEPFASIFGMAADTAATMEAPSDEVFDRAFAAAKDNIANKTFLLGVENLAKAWANPKRYGTSMAKSLAATFVPAGSLLGATARGMDPVQRITSGETFGESMINAAKNRIPGLRQTLEPRYSVTGNPIMDEYAAENMISPLRAADATPTTIVDAEISRLAQMGHDVPNLQRRKRNVPGEARPVRATAAEYAPFHEFNKQAAETLESIISSPSWSTMSPEAQSKIIMGVYKKYGKYSSKIVRHQMTQNRL